MNSKKQNNQPSSLLKPVMTAQEMAALDKYTIETIGIPGIVLMENAGRRVAAVARKMLRELLQERRATIVCGKGNNGGDGYVVARLLHEMGVRVAVVMTADTSAISGDAASNLAILDKLAIDHTGYDADHFNDTIRQSDLIVDALLGTGVTGKLRGTIAEIVHAINNSGKPVLAIDLPTGMNADTGAVEGECVQATATVTMGCLKRGMLFSPGREQAGRIHVADIGFPAAALNAMGSGCFLTTAAYMQEVLPRRRGNAFKNECGQVFILAGSAGMTGAAAMTASATLRAGAGLAILGIPKSLQPILAAKLTEVMTLPLPETAQQTFSFTARNELSARLEWADVIAIGPGLSTHSDCKKLVNWLITSYSGTMVLDADALNCLADDSRVLNQAAGQVIITPHPGELGRLLKKSSQTIIANPVEIAVKAAKELNAVVVLKGGPTVVADPQGRAVINSSGNAGMATAGMGDVLTGVIAGLAGQGASAFDAAVAGVYLHGCAGDRARDEIGEAGLVAGDVLDRIPHVIRNFERKGGTEVVFD